MGSLISNNVPQIIRVLAVKQVIPTPVLPDKNSKRPQGVALGILLMALAVRQNLAQANMLWRQPVTKCQPTARMVVNMNVINAARMIARRLEHQNLIPVRRQGRPNAARLVIISALAQVGLQLLITARLLGMMTMVNGAETIALRLALRAQVAPLVLGTRNKFMQALRNAVVVINANITPIVMLMITHAQGDGAILTTLVENVLLADILARLVLMKQAARLASHLARTVAAEQEIAVSLILGLM